MRSLVITGTLSSLEISHITGKRHSDVLRDIQVIEENLKKDYNANLRSTQIPDVNTLWEYSSYRASNGRIQPCVNLTKKGSLLLATKYSDSIRLRLIERWETLERTNALPDFTDPAAAAMAWAQQFNETKAIANKLRLAENKLDEQHAKVVFADCVKGSSNSVLVRQFAKDLTDDGFKIGQNRLYEWLRENKYLSKDNEPYQNYMERGYFEVVTRTIGSGDDTITVKTTKITGKGQIYFTEKLRNSSIKELLTD